ncbi:MAG: hypothetical protein WBN94_08255 [Methanothrix sp.]
MTSDVTVVSMAKRFALITHRFLDFDLLFGEEDQPGSAIAARKMEKVGPDQEQSFTDRGRPAGTGAGARARSAHGYAGACGEGAAKAREREVVR